MANVIINPQSGILEFNTGTAGSSVFDNSFSGAARLTFNTGEVNLKSYATGVLDRFTVDGSQGRLFSVSDSLTGSIFSVNDIAGLPIIEVNSTTTDIVNIGTYGTNALVVSGSGIGMGVAAPTAKLDIRDTWNNAATTFTAVKADVTDTSSNAASLLMDLRVGGVTKMKVVKDGSLSIDGSITRIGNDPLVLRDTTEVAKFGSARSTFRGLAIGGSISSPSVFLERDADNILAQRNGANAQTFRLYNTYTDASNYERGFFRWNTNLLEIGAEAAGTGTSRNLSLLTAGSARLSIDSAGNVTLGDNVRTDLTLLDIIARGDGDGIRLYSKNNTAGGSVNAPSISFYRSTTGPSASARFKIAGHNGSDFSGFSLSSPDISADWIRASNNLNDLGIGGTGLAIASYQRHYFFNSVVVGKDLGASSIPESGIIRSGQKLNNVTNIAGSNLTLQAGAGTGNSNTNGSIILQTPDPTVSGTDIQSYSSKLVLSRLGNVGLGIVAPIAALDIARTWNSNLTVTGASGNGATATLTFAEQTTAIPVGATIVVASVNPSGYNGTYTVTASTTTSVSYANATTTAWVSGGTIQQLFTAIKADITDTSSASGSLLMDLRVGGTSKASISKNGGFIASAGQASTKAGFIFGDNSGIYQSGQTYFSNGGTAIASFGANGLRMTTLEFVPTIGVAADGFIARDAANTLAQRNGANAQESRVYGTYTDATNYERLSLKYNSTATAFQIGTEKGSGGGTARALEFQTDGTTRVIIGADGVFSVDGVRVGRGAGAVSSNTALGNLALNVNTTGSSNTAVGNGALSKNTTGIINTAVGSNALPNNTTGGINTAVGSGALLTNTTGNNNSAVGNNSLFSNTTGSNNVALGNTAGRYIADGSTANAVTTNGVYIGADTKALASGQTNQIVIGHNAIGIGSNTVVLGNDSITTTALKGNVGIGTSSPASKLTITGGDAEVTDSASGVILKSPDGTRYRITVANGGTLTVTAV